jgi:small subunit ribosomal protein S1
MDALREALSRRQILEARALVCDGGHNLIVELGCCRGVIPRAETVIGVGDGSTRDVAILSRVGKPVCFFVTEIVQEDGKPLAILSRRRVQELCRARYVSRLIPGDVIGCRVTHLEPFGAFVDVGAGVTSLIPVDAISVSRISHPRDRFQSGQDIRAAVKNIDSCGRITLTHKELLGTWAENAAAFTAGETVAGIIRSVESYGAFVELTPNLAGLAEPHESAAPGRHAGVYIKSLIPGKMKVKLIIVDCFDAAYLPSPPYYFVRDDHLARWRYSPPESERVVETIF